MKKIIISLILCLVTLNSYSQKTIHNPYFTATTAQYVKITKIELSDTSTILSFDVTYFPKSWIKVNAKETYIQDSRGGEKLYVKSAEGIELDKEITTPESGRNIYKLFFPTVDKNTTSLDFIEERWRIFDIDVVPQEHFSIIPQELKGNWLRTDGSNEWVIGIHKNMIIYENEFWDKVLINSKNNVFNLLLRRNDNSKNIVIKKTKNNNLLIGNDLKNLSLLSRNKTFKKNYLIANDSDFKLPIFNKDTFIYKGYIKGYHPKMGKTGILYIVNMFEHMPNSNLVTINADGTFLVKCLMLYPQVTFMRILGKSITVFAEPGKSTIQFIDLSEYNLPFKTQIDRKNRERRSLFMGDNARVNADLQSIDSINYYDNTTAEKETIEYNADQYKTYCLDIMNKENEMLQKYLNNNLLCKKALTIKQFEIPYRAYERILWFDVKKSLGYLLKPKLKQDSLPNNSLQPDFYNFINPVLLDNPVSFVCGSVFKTLINRIEFSPCVRNVPSANYVFSVLSDSLNTKSIKLSPEEVILLNKLKTNNDIDSIEMLKKQDSIIWKRIESQHNKLIDYISENAYENNKDNNFLKYFGLKDGLIKEILLSQKLYYELEKREKSFTEKEKQYLRKNLQNEFIVDYLMDISNTKEMEAKSKISTKPISSHKNDTPNTRSDKLFESIINKYKGKVILVDFWATWCSPCRSDIKKIKPLKEELKDKDVVFLYITDESSPVDKWNESIADIAGEHYRLKTDEMNYLKSKFNFSGIPHYELVSKEGKVLDERLYFSSSFAEFRILLDKYLK